MAYSRLGQVETYVAGGSISKNTLLKFDSSDDAVVVATAATDLIIGVALNDAASGERVEVQVSGIAEVKSAGAISRGAFVTATTAGEAVALAAAATIKTGIGRALKTAADDDIFPMLITHFQAVTA
ncbi:MAG TPA: DUF2190 domain-containing protein [Gammaproteobacteria bacterium]|nr:DUF2190 domain-containing protein [Gammaproteobacteria bacterium]MCH76856.1 DUF2190 domain-containing protein [Gammaproteobacteria bacterium]